VAVHIALRKADIEKFNNFIKEIPKRHPWLRGIEIAQAIRPPGRATLWLAFRL
jgi:hypothetical protein